MKEATATQLKAPCSDLRAPYRRCRSSSLPPLQARRAGRSSVAVQAANRPLWQPGVTPPAHLDGSLPGDFGFGEGCHQ